MASFLNGEQDTITARPMQQGWIRWVVRPTHQNQLKNSIDSGLVKLKTPIQWDSFMNRSAIFGQHKEQGFYNYFACFPKSGQNLVKFDFRSQPVLLSTYSTRVNSRDVKKSWDVIGSSDRTMWELIDAIRDADITKEKREQVFRYQMQKGLFRYVRYIQLVNCERDQKCQDFIQISSIEFFTSRVSTLRLIYEHSESRRDLWGNRHYPFVFCWTYKHSGRGYHAMLHDDSKFCKFEFSDSVFHDFDMPKSIQYQVVIDS
jgi:hypothetical protein